jgi:outer membrane protein assembly factor BamB
LRADDHTPVTSAWTEFTLGAVVDVSGSEPAVKTLAFLDDHHPMLGAGAGVMFCEDTAGDRTLEAFDVADGRPRWTQRPAAGTRFGQPLIAAGRVYVIQQTGQSESDTSIADGVDVVVLEARTGRQLHATRLPGVPPDGASQDISFATELAPWQAGNGMVIFGREGMFMGTTGDLLVVSE